MSKKSSASHPQTGLLPNGRAYMRINIKLLFKFNSQTFRQKMRSFLSVFSDAVACVDPDECLKYCGTTVGCSNIAYPKLLLKILPTGLKGIKL